MTYNVFGGTLNLAQLNAITARLQRLGNYERDASPARMQRLLRWQLIHYTTQALDRMDAPALDLRHVVLASPEQSYQRHDVRAKVISKCATTVIPRGRTSWGGGRKSDLPDF